MTERLLAHVLVAYVIAVTGGVFVYNLPNWCDNPDVGFNSIVQPLCK